MQDQEQQQSLKKESTNAPLPDIPPADITFRPFWVMKVMAKTVQSGGFLTPKIYVPKSVWFQDGMKFLALRTKIESCAAINESLLKMKEIPIDDPEVAKELELFCTLLGSIQNTLAKTMYFISEYKDDTDKDNKNAFGNAIKKMVGRVMGKAKLDDASSYILLLLDVFENSQFLEKWLLYHLERTPSSPYTNRLRRISDFFYTVICNFVIKDLNSLMIRYVKHAKDSFDKTEPPVTKKDK